MTMDSVQRYIETQRDRFLNELFELLRIPSVSASPDHTADVQRAAQWLAEALQRAGADEVELCPTAGYPIVLAHRRVDPTKPTILVYGHYDVQPPDPLELWQTPPFEPTLREGRIYARGACDDKGQMYAQVKAFEAMVQADALPCNVTFLIEGEEEVGSVHLAQFVAQQRDRLKADVVLISDTDIPSLETPTITTGLRGMVYLQVKVTGASHDLHSGHYGGAVPNPINALCEMIAQLKDDWGQVTVPGFYDEVLAPTPEERAAVAEVPFDLAEFQRELGLNAVVGEAGYTSLERTTLRPALDVNGIWGGYTGHGAKTVIPSIAQAKISMRLVPNQRSGKIAQLFSEYFATLAPPGITVAVENLHGGEAAVTPTDSIAYRAASLAYEATFGKKPLPLRAGGSIPIVALFEAELGIKSVLMGFGLPTDRIHSPNEHFGLENYYKGIATIPYFYHYFSELQSA